MSNINPENGAIICEAGSETTKRLERLIAGVEALLIHRGVIPAAVPSTGGQRSNTGGGEFTTLPNYGRSKGAPIEGASLTDLEFYANGARRSINDPAKARWHDKERQLLAALEAEIIRQGGKVSQPSAQQTQQSYGSNSGGSNSGGSDASGNGGAPGDDDIPFGHIELRLDHP